MGPAAASAPTAQNVSEDHACEEVARPSTATEATASTPPSAPTSYDRKENEQDDQNGDESADTWAARSPSSGRAFWISCAVHSGFSYDQNAVTTRRRLKSTRRWHWLARVALLMKLTPSERQRHNRSVRKRGRMVARLVPSAVILAVAAASFAELTSSLTAMAFLPLLSVIWINAETALVLSLVAGFVMYKHAANISRIRKGEEPKFEMGKK